MYLASGSFWDVDWVDWGGSQLLPSDFRCHPLLIARSNATYSNKTFTSFSAKFAFCILLCFRIPLLSNKWKSRRKSQNQQKFQCGRRRLAANKTRPMSTVSVRRHLQCIVGKTTDFPDLKVNERALLDLFRSKLTSHACEPRAGFTDDLVGIGDQTGLTLFFPRTYGPRALVTTTTSYLFSSSSSSFFFLITTA